MSASVCNIADIAFVQSGNSQWCNRYFHRHLPQGEMWSSTRTRSGQPQSLTKGDTLLYSSSRGLEI